MELIMLGTGHAGVTDYYNTCFLLHDENGYLLTDAGGGNGILKQLKAVNVRPQDIHDLIVTHRHTDHLLGVLWLFRMVRGSELRIHSHSEVIRILREMMRLLMPDKTYENIHLIEVQDGETVRILGREVTFFDVHAAKARQFGYVLRYGEGKTLVCLGDEPYNEECRRYAQGSTWLMHEAFCREADEHIFDPHRISHSTVRDACVNAESLQAENLILYHTEDRTKGRRKQLYTEEGKQYYHGTLYVPEDLETIELIREES